MLKRAHTFVKSIVTDEVDGVKTTRRFSQQEEGVEQDGSEDEEKEDELEDDETGLWLSTQESYRLWGGKPEALLFAQTIAEKRKLHAEKLAEVIEELKVFDEEAKLHEARVVLELEEEFDEFFKHAVLIVKQTRDMEESRTLERLGLENEDTFDGKNFSFKKIKKGEKTVDEVSKLFRPRRSPGMGRFRQDDDDLDFMWFACCMRRKKTVNYDPLTEKEFARFQRHYPGLRKFFSKQKSSSDMAINANKLWLGDNVSMKLMAEYIWRYTHCIIGFDAEGAKGFERRHCLMVMQALKECTKLKTLNLKDTKLCREGAAAAALVAKVSPQLEFISMVNTSMEDAGAVFWGLALTSGSPSLQALDLSNCKIGPNGATAIAIGLSMHQSLRVLNLSNNKIGREGCRRIGEALLVNPILEELDLSRSSIGSRGASSIAAFVIHPRCRLKSLILNDNDIGRRGGAALAVAVSINKSIFNLELGFNDLGDPGAAGFGIALQRNSTLRILDLRDCDITDIGAAGIAIGLETNKTLRTLNLSQQVIADSGVVHIATMLKNNPSPRLKVLDLSTNCLRIRAAVALADMLKVNRSVEELYLYDNEIPDEGGIALGEVLSEGLNKTLKKIDVSENPISASVAINYFAKAEARLVRQKTARLDVVAKNTSMALNNLRGCGVVIMRSQMTKFYFIVYTITALVGGWFDFISDVLVAYTTMYDAIYNNGSWIYSVLATLFVAIPFFYVIIVFSLPEYDPTQKVEIEDGGGDASGSELEEDDQQEHAQEHENHSPATKVSRYFSHGSSLIFGQSLYGGGSGGFMAHIKRVWTSSFDYERLFLLIINATQTRQAYEVYKSYKQGLTTLALSSIRLTDTVFEAMPQSILQLHILFSTLTLKKIQEWDSVLGPDNDFSVLVLITSLCFSVSMLSNTLTNLYEEKCVVNWKRVALANEELAYWIGFFGAYFYHMAHYIFRAFTIVLIASIFDPLLAAAFFAFGFGSRLLIWFVTKSERRKLFAVVSYLVGSAVWDTRLACRLAVLVELLETVIVIPPLWMSPEVVKQTIENAPLGFQDNWLVMIEIIGPQFFTAVVYGSGAIALGLYFLFIEKIHSYRDVYFEVDPVDALDLAETPFGENTVDVQKERRKILLTKGMSGFGAKMYKSATELAKKQMPTHRGSWFSWKKSTKTDLAADPADNA